MNDGRGRTSRAHGHFFSVRLLVTGR